MESFSEGFLHAIMFFFDSRNSTTKTVSFQSIASLKTTLLTLCHFLINFSAKCSSVRQPDLWVFLVAGEVGGDLEYPIEIPDFASPIFSLT